MNNEVMARAVTELDDGLIAGAHTFSKKRRFSRPAARLLAAAACVTVIFCAVFAFFSYERIEVSVNGETVSGQPIAVAGSTLNRSVPQELSVEITIRTDKPISVEASDGFIGTNGSDTDRKTLALTGDTTLMWTVENPDIGQEYFLSLGRKTGLTLSYDESLNKWTILKTRR